MENPLPWLLVLVLLAVLVLLLLREKKNSRAMIEKEAELLHAEWLKKEAPKLRKEAAQASQAVTLGKSLEHLLPYFTGFPFNPKDVRFLGSPVDLVVFDGLSEGALKEVVFIEVKTGKSAALPEREKMVKACIEARQVKWQLIHYR